MRVSDILLVTFKNLFRQKNRSLLTIVQMMVGVFLISMMLSIGNGLKDFMISQITLFSNKQTMSTYKGSQGIVQRGIHYLGFGQKVEEYVGDDEINDGSEIFFTTSELKDVREIPHVSQAAFQYVIIADYIRLGFLNSKKLNISLDCMPLLLRQRLRFTRVNDEKIILDTGILLPEGYADAWGMSKEELLGTDVWIRFTQTGTNLQDLFEYKQPISNQLRTKEFKFEIVGFVEKNVFSQMGFISPTMGDEISAYIVDKDLYSFQQKPRFNEIRLIVDEEENVEYVKNELESLEYNTMTYDDSVGQIGVVFNIISVALTIFGLISVGVSSIGIANTLLMAVYERRREIGVMKAVGASSRIIQRLFIVEAIWLGILGGGLGLFTSFLISKIANSFLQNGLVFQDEVIVEGLLSQYPALNISVYPFWMVISIMILTVVVAIIAGLSPANKASKLDPIIVLKQ